MFERINDERPSITVLRRSLPVLVLGGLIPIISMLSPVSFAKQFIRGINVLHQTPVASHVDRLGNYDQRLRGFDTATEAIDFINFAGSFKTAMGSNNEIEADLKNLGSQDPIYAQELVSMNNAIEQAKLIKDLHARAEFINKYVNDNMSYNQSKSDNDDRHASSIKEMILSKEDTCFGFAARKHYMLMRSNFPADDAMTIRTKLYNSTVNPVDHAVEAVKIDGKTFILEQKVEGESNLIPADVYFDPEFGGVNGLTAVPEIGINEKGAVLFKKGVVSSHEILAEAAHQKVTSGYPPQVRHLAQISSYEAH